MVKELEDALLVDLRIFRHSTSRDNLEFHLAAPIADPVDTVGEYIDLLRCIADADKRAIMFVESVAHCEHVAGAVRRLGTPAMGLYGSMQREEKAKILMDWKSTPGAVLVSTTCGAQGVDYPNVCVVVVVFEPKDRNLLIQMVGRGGRSGVPCKCFIVAKSQLRSDFESSKCIRHALHKFADGHDKAYKCIDKQGAALCSICSIEHPKPFGHLSPLRVPSSVSVEISSKCQELTPP